jgi:hypothetical protein
MPPIAAAPRLPGDRRAISRAQSARRLTLGLRADSLAPDRVLVLYGLQTSEHVGTMRQIDDLKS